MDYKADIRTLKTFVMAHELLLSHVLEELANTKPKMAAAIRKGFDRAADGAERMAIAGATSNERREISVDILRIIEEVRVITFPKLKRPRVRRQPQ